MWGVVGMLVSTFVLIRDLFVYLIPGAVLFGATLFSGVPQGIVATYSAKVAFVPKPEWLKVAVLVAVCYALGHVLVALGYMVLDFLKTPTKPASPSIYYRYRYPSLFFETERRSIIADFRFGLGIALVFSALILLCTDWRLSVGALVPALIILWAAHTARAHVADYTAAALEAAKQAKDDGIPPEPRGPAKAANGGKAAPDAG